MMSNLTGGLRCRNHWSPEALNSERSGRSSVFELHVPIPIQCLCEPSFQFQPLRLAGGGVGDVLTEQDDLGSLRKNQAAPAKLQERGLRRLLALPRDDVSRDLLAIKTVLERHGHRKLHGRMAFQNVVEFQGSDIHPAADDQFLEPPGNEKEKPPPFVAKREPLVARAKPAPSKRGFIGIRSLEIPRTHRSSLDADFPAAAFGDFFASIVQDRHVVMPDREADGGKIVIDQPPAMLLSRKIIRQEGRVTGCFRQAVAVTDGKPKGVFETTGGLLQEGPGA